VRNTVNRGKVLTALKFDRGKFEQCTFITVKSLNSGKK
jgi:hypothetical protein